MSRSYRKTPICSIACTPDGAQKNYKRQEHRRERRSVTKNAILSDNIPDSKEFGNEWDSPRDGKQYLKNTKENQKWLRK